MQNKIFTTEDGSHSVVSGRFDECYHSRYGAIEESNTVFIRAGLEYFDKAKSEINILEIGFGTGLNALLTLARFNDLNHLAHIQYHGIEAYPITADLAQELNYCDSINLPDLKDDFLTLHQEKTVTLQRGDRVFDFQFIESLFEDYEYPAGYYDLIYFDAFAPNTQPALWEADLISQMYRTLRSGGILTTYCAKGSFKRTLKSAGFSIEPLPGPGKKREITRAVKTID